MINLDDFFLRLPHPAKQLLVSSYGYILYHKRYRGSYNDILALVKKSKSWTREQIEDYQSENIKIIIDHAYNEVPYYNKFFKKYGITKSQIQTPSDLQVIPALEKETLRTKADEFIAKNPKSYITNKTSGSTGTPTQIHIDENTYKIAMALLADYEENNNISPKGERATFAGRILKYPNDTEPPFWLYNHAERQMLYSSYHLDNKSVHHYVNSLNKLRPSEIIGYPSAISELASLIEENSLELEFLPMAIITNSENLHTWQSKKISEVFKAPVRDYYSTAEYLNFCSLDQSNIYRSSPLPGITELDYIDSQQASLIMTTLTNKAMPLIRYKIGDVATIDNSGANIFGCPSFTNIEGRIDDYLTTKDGRKIGRLSQVFKSVGGLKEAQIVQYSIGSAIINVVSGENDSIDMEHLNLNLRKRLPSDFNIEIKEVKEIPRQRNGKFKLVVKSNL